MIRNLKILFAAALALMAFGALAVSAHAADEFHCSIEKCRGKLVTDGTGATAHHVFIVENKAKTESISFTCESLRGTAEFVSPNDVSLGWIKGSTDREAYDNCKVNGSPGVVVHMNSCKFTFTNDARDKTEKETFPKAGTEGRAEVHVLCESPDEIEVTLPSPSTCVFDIPTQTLGNGEGERGGIGYHTIGEGANREVTVTALVHGIIVTTRGNCEAFIKPGQELEGTYTTGNTIVTGEDEKGNMAAAWFE